MKHFKRTCERIFFPSVSMLISNAFLILALTACVFISAELKRICEYILYLVSAYTLTIVLCCSFRYIKAKCLKKAEANPLLKKIICDAAFRTHCSLYVALTINVLYAGINLCSGIYYFSFWAITLAVYYLFLSVARFVLLRYMGKKPLNKNMMDEYRQYQYSSALLLLMNIALAGIIILAAHESSSVHYSGVLIYIMAAYSFYQIILSVYNVIKFRKHKSPVLSASKSVNFVVALVSMFSLEISMLSEFGSDMAKEARLILLLISGTVIWVLAFSVGIYMYLRALFYLRRYAEKSVCG